MATNGFCLVYLEIGDGVLREVSHAQLDYGISCLDINPIGERADYSRLAAVGMWRDFSVRIFFLPGLQLVTMELLGEFVPRSVLLCVFEGVCLCLSFLSFYSCLDSFSVILLITIISSYLRSWKHRHGQKSLHVNARHKHSLDTAVCVQQYLFI